MIDSSTSNPSLADADTLFSALFGFFNELSANALLAWMVGFVLFVIFSMWQLEKLASRLAQKRATSSASYDRRSRNASKLSSDNFLHTQSYADAEASRTAFSLDQAQQHTEDSAFTQSPVTEDSSGAIGSEVEDPNSADDGAEVPSVETLPTNSPESTLNHNHVSALEASNNRIAAAEAYSNELKTRVAESQLQIKLLEEKLALAEKTHGKTKAPDHLVVDQTEPSNTQFQELEAKLADTNRELEGATANAVELKSALQEATTKLERFEDVERQVADENAELQSELEKLNLHGSRASEETELKNQELLGKLELASAGHSQSEQDLDKANERIAEQQSRIDSQDALLKETRLEKLELLQKTTDHETALAELKQQHDEKIKISKAEFDATSGELHTRATKLQTALDAAEDEVERLRDEASATNELFETFKSKENQSLQCLDKLEQRLAESVASFENEQSLRTDVELSVEQLEQKLKTRTDAFSQLEADLVKAETALSESKEFQQQRELELQAELERFEKELSIRAEESSQLKADLLEAEEEANAGMTNHQQREVELQGEVERLKQELVTRTETASQLEADLLKAEETVSASKSIEERREVELKAEIERLEQQLSTTAAESTQLKANLLKSEEATNASIENYGRREIELQGEVERLTQELTTRMAAVSQLEADLLKAEETVSEHKEIEGQREVELKAEVGRLEQELADRENECSQLKVDLSAAEEAIDASKLSERQRDDELRGEAGRLQQELTAQSAETTQLKAELLTAEEAIVAIEATYQQRETKLQHDVRGLEDELATRVSAITKLEADLLQAEQALGVNQADEEKRALELQANVERLEKENKKLQSELETERTSETEVSEKISAGESRLAQLEQELSNASINRANYKMLANKMVSYKQRYRENKLQIEELTGKNKSMKALATEYFEAAKKLRTELDEQLNLTESLKQKLQSPHQSSGRSENSSTQGSSNDLSQSEINSLVEQRARKYVLELKSHFEMRIKRKNDLIRELRESSGIQSGGKRTKRHSGENGVNPPKGQAKRHTNGTRQDNS